MTKSFFIKPFVDEGLGNSAYLIGSRDTKQAILIDPLRDVDQYLQVASEQGLSITHVLDTHLHADFVSGCRELAQQAGAQIGASAQAGLEFAHLPLTEASVIDMGAFQIQVMTTPGHSPEHVSYLLVEPDVKTPKALFSGGALIVGGAARSDLLGHEHTHDLVHALYHTIHDKLMKLPDELDVFPTHGAGSFCVAPASKERVTTIGQERQSNPLMKAKDEAQFQERALAGLPSYPTYYKYMRALNKQGARILGGVPLLKPLDPTEVQAMQEAGMVVLDIRHQKSFGAGHIPGSYGIRVEAPLSTWAGWVIPFGRRLILVSDSEEQRYEATRQLIRIGYDDLAGYLEGGIDAWAKKYPVDSVPSISPAELHDDLNNRFVLDVRQQSEWEEGHIPNAIHFEGGRIPWEEPPFAVDQPVVVQCASGNRSMIAISVLQRRGYRNLTQLDGGLGKWKKNGFETVQDAPAD